LDLNILITGSSGFIGKSLTTELSKDNTIFTIDRNPSQNLNVSKNFTGDLSDRETLFSIKENIDVIFHFGSISSIAAFKGHEAELFASETKAFINVLEFARERDVGTVIYPSTASVYKKDRATGSIMVDPTNIYGVLKLTEEHLAALYSQELKTIGLRIFMVYGPGEETKGERASPISKFIFDVVKGRSPIIYGDGNQSRDAIYIGDLTEILKKLLLFPNIPSIVDICSGVEVTFNQIISLIKKVTDAPVHPTYVPKPISYVEGAAGNPEIAKKLLRRPFTSLEEGIRKTYLHALNSVSARKRMGNDFR